MIWVDETCLGFNTIQNMRIVDILGSCSIWDIFAFVCICTLIPCRLTSQPLYVIHLNWRYLFQQCSTGDRCLSSPQGRIARFHLGWNIHIWFFQPETHENEQKDTRKLGILPVKLIRNILEHYQPKWFWWNLPGKLLGDRVKFRNCPLDTQVTNCHGSVNHPGLHGKVHIRGRVFVRAEPHSSGEHDMDVDITWGSGIVEEFLGPPTKNNQIKQMWNCNTLKES